MIAVLGYRLVDGRRYKTATLAVEGDMLVIIEPPPRFLHVPRRFDASLSRIRCTKVDDRRVLIHAEKKSLGVKAYADFEILFREPSEMESLVKEIPASTTK